MHAGSAQLTLVDSVRVWVPLRLLTPKQRSGRGGCGGNCRHHEWPHPWAAEHGQARHGAHAAHRQQEAGAICSKVGGAEGVSRSVAVVRAAEAQLKRQTG